MTQIGVGLEPEALERELPGELDGALLEVVADREVAEHLEERQVPVRAADVVDVDRAEALLAGRQAVGRRLLGTEEVGLERVHARADQQRRRIVARHQRRRRQARVPALGEVGEEALADLVGGHRGERVYDAVTDDHVASHQACELARRGTVDRLSELQLEPSTCAGPNPARQRLGPVAELDAVDLRSGAVQHRVAHRDLRGRERRPRADRDRVRLAVLGQHVERLRGGDAEPLALADREQVLATVATDGPPGAVDDRTGALAQAPVAGEERALAGAGEEAQVLRLALVRDRQPGGAGELAHLRLAQLAEREPQPRERGRRERGEHVALVLRPDRPRHAATRRAVTRA